MIKLLVAATRTRSYKMPKDELTDEEVKNLCYDVQVDEIEIHQMNNGEFKYYLNLHFYQFYACEL